MTKHRREDGHLEDANAAEITPDNQDRNTVDPTAAPLHSQMVDEDLKREAIAKEARAKESAANLHPGLNGIVRDQAAKEGDPDAIARLKEEEVVSEQTEKEEKAKADAEAAAEAEAAKKREGNNA